MDFKKLFEDKTIRPKEKTEMLSIWVLANPKKVSELIDFAKTSKDPIKATCIEALEFASRSLPDNQRQAGNPKIVTRIWLDFATEMLKEKAPRIKWESAKVVGNIAPLFPKDLEKAMTNLLNNSEHEGTVVRWSTAFALGEIIKIKLPINKDLIPVAEAICEREEKNSIKKIYLAALKKVK